MAEKQRIEGIQMSQAERVQQAEASGAQFMFQQRENREQQKIDRTAAQLDNARMAMNQARADRTSAMTGMIGGIANSFASAYSKS